MNPRAEAVELFQEMIGFLSPKLKELDEESQRKFWKYMRGVAEKKMEDDVEKKMESRAVSQCNGPDKLEMQERMDEAWQIVEEIGQLSGDVPPAGEEFAQSVLDRAGDIWDTIERSGRVSDAQFQALENMLNGLSNWIRE